MRKVILFLALVVVLAFSASAMTLSDATIGSDKQDRVNNVSSTFTVKNDNNATALTDLQFTSSAAGKYDVTFTDVPASIAPLQSATITVSVDIPNDHDGVDSNLAEKALKIGTITGTGKLGTASDTGSSDLEVQANNEGIIDKVRASCEIQGEGTKTQTLDDGDKVKNLRPGSTCTFEITVENTFDDNDFNYDIDFDLSSDVSDGGDIDFDIDDDEVTVSAEDKDVLEASAIVEEDANNDARVKLLLTGIDENGAKHGQEFEFRLEVKRNSKEIDIRSAQVSPTTVSNCEDSSVLVSVNIRNIGKKNEDEAAVEISIPDLTYTDKQQNIELDKDDSRTVTFNVPVPKGAKAQVYRADLTTFFDTLAASNTGNVEFTVTECTKPTTEPPKTVVVKKNGTEVTTPTTTVKPTIPSSKTAATAPKKSEGFTESGAYVALLATLSVLLAIAIVVIIVLFTGKKK